jgi:CRP-like cAMP-binding protein
MSLVPTTTICPCAHPCPAAQANATLLSAGEVFRFERGETLWKQGDPAEWLLVVCTGTLKLARAWPGGRDAILDLAHRGHFAGVTAALPEGRHTSSATVLAAGKGIRVPRAKLRPILKQNPEIMAFLFELACNHMENFVQRIEEMAHGPVENRLARVILRIGDDVGLPDSRGLFVPVRLTRGDLAGMVGCRVETTIRVLTRWQRQGLLETRREGLVIRDRKRLISYSEQDVQ